MNLKDLKDSLVKAAEQGLGNLPVLLDDSRLVSFVFAVHAALPMTKAYSSGAAPYVLGRSNARKFVCVESNLAFYPNITESRRDCMTVSQFIKSIEHASDESVVLGRSGALRDNATFRPLIEAGVVRVTGSGRPLYVSRGGIQSFMLRA